MPRPRPAADYRDNHATQRDDAADHRDDVATRVTGMHSIATTWLITGIETRVITPMTSSRASTMSATNSPTTCSG